LFDHFISSFLHTNNIKWLQNDESGGIQENHCQVSRSKFEPTTSSKQLRHSSDVLTCSVEWLLQCSYYVWWLLIFYGVRLCLWTAATKGHIVHPADDMRLENDGEMILTGENRRTRRKTCPVTFCPSKIPDWLTRASAVRRRRLTAWAMARPHGYCWT
jgi:hypothetical protein